ncbi:prostaglandin reductase 1-like isoform X1 [Leguminivora glycinivorella]|uniref:prostaglandin reductase 1-like isoform X1 n=1 Tax=Leguminivora glycinivorella TaxID=1035111 RepID=UPI00200F95A3|nr:prostaglandin reductase 1-like isoform X1 [Leguminivora glycinivorella]
MLKQLSTSAFFCAKRAYSNVTGKINARKYVLTKYFQGEPKQSDFKIVEEELPELKDGEILTEAEYLSVDPYMRAYMIGYKLPTDMIGGQVAKIIASRNDQYPVGKYVAGSFGWRTHTICNPKSSPYLGFMPITLLPDMSPHPISLGLGVIGMPGNTAYFGVKEILYPKAGETIAITGAAGAVGSHVGQIGKILGCRVIGFAGTDEKCEYLQKELGFDHAFNYKTANIKTALREGAPNRIDCYFDNVGGEISSTIMGHMNKYGRVAVCGSISSYNDTTLPKVTILQPSIVFKELKVEGFLVNRWLDRWDEGIKANMNWLQEGKIKYEEKVYSGFDNMVEALVGILRGENTGKAVVKVK